MRKKCDHLIYGTLWGKKIQLCNSNGDYTPFKGKCCRDCSGYHNKIMERKEKLKKLEDGK